jgi:hypothetical protein
MDEHFRKLIESLEPKFKKLISMKSVKYKALPRPLTTKFAVYLFSEDNSHLYVGRTKNLRQRLQGHCTPSSTHFSASFAFRIARQETGRLKATYTAKGSRQNLVIDPVFGQAFETAKKRVSSMDIRYVEEVDQTNQALLEIYAATVLKTPYNDFDTH